MVVILIGTSQQVFFGGRFPWAANSQSARYDTVLNSEKQLGSEHPDTAASLDNLAGLYHEQGRYAEAEPLYHQAAQVSLACLGLEHPQTQQILRNHLMLLAEMHTNGDMEMLLQLLASEQEDPPMKETMQE